MAIATSRGLTSRNLLLLRSLSSLTSSPLNLTAPLSDPPASPDQPLPDALDLDNTAQLFASVKTATLVTSFLNLYAMGADPLVELGTAVMQSPAVMQSRLGKAAVVGAVRATVYRHFCAGETDEEVSETVRGMWERVGLRSILDYAAEDAEDADVAGRNLDGFQRTVDMAATLPPRSVSAVTAV